MDLAALKTEITTDPQAMGYAPKLASGDLGGIAAALNSLSGAGAGVIPRRAVPLSDPALASMLAYALPRIRTLSNQSDRDYYMLLISSINAVGVVYAQDPNVQASMAQAVADGVITSALAGTIAQRIGSRAEVLWGEGATVSSELVALALRS